jgi:hypothetical protein
MMAASTDADKFPDLQLAGE